MIPVLAAISCKTMVAKIESTIAQSNVDPKRAPAIVHSVTVPGPIKAAATKVPGPIFLNHLNIYVKYIVFNNATLPKTGITRFFVIDFMLILKYILLYKAFSNLLLLG